MIFAAVGWTHLFTYREQISAASLFDLSLILFFFFIFVLLFSSFRQLLKGRRAPQPPPRELLDLLFRLLLTRHASKQMDGRPAVKQRGNAMVKFEKSKISMFFVVATTPFSGNDVSLSHFVAFRFCNRKNPTPSLPFLQRKENRSLALNFPLQLRKQIKCSSSAQQTQSTPLLL